MGTFSVPVYDNADLRGEPVARLRGNMIFDQSNGFTANGAFFFYQEQALVGVQVSYTNGPTFGKDFDYCFTVGGTGALQHYNAAVTADVVEEEPKYVVEWTFCPYIYSALKPCRASIEKNNNNILL